MNTTYKLLAIVVLLGGVGALSAKSGTIHWGWKGSDPDLKLRVTHAGIVNVLDEKNPSYTMPEIPEEFGVACINTKTKLAEIDTPLFPRDFKNHQDLELTCESGGIISLKSI